MIFNATRRRSRFFLVSDINAAAAFADFFPQFVTANLLAGLFSRLRHCAGNQNRVGAGNGRMIERVDILIVSPEQNLDPLAQSGVTVTRR